MARIKKSPNRLPLKSSETYGVWDSNIVEDFSWKDYQGFVYEIVNVDNGKSYIGSKFFKFKTSKRKCGSTTKMSDWKVYTSSSISLNKDIDENQVFTFTILSLHKDRESLILAETTLQKELDVLHAKDVYGNRLYYNGCIAGKDFVNINKEPYSEERRRKIGANRDYSKEVWGSEAEVRCARKNKERVWWNDGVKSYFLLDDECKVGLVKGRVAYEEEGTCLYCKAVFKKKNKARLFCNSSCNSRWKSYKRSIAKLSSTLREGISYHRYKVLHYSGAKPIKIKSIKEIKPEFRDNLCKNCGEKILYSSGKLLHCSEQCKDDYKKKSLQERNNKTPWEVNCSMCGSVITTTRKSQHLCSKKCRWKSKRLAKKKRMSVDRQTSE